MIFSPCKWVLMLVNRPVLARKSVSLRWTLGPFVGWGLIENLPWVQGMARTMSHPLAGPTPPPPNALWTRRRPTFFPAAFFQAWVSFFFFRQRGKNEAEARKSTKLMRNGGGFSRGFWGARRSWSAPILR